MISHEEKRQIVEKFGKNAQDTGSTAVQVAILTTRINNLKPHFQKNIHDFHSNRGLLKMIGHRKSLLKYLAEKNHDEYKKVIKELGLRK